MQIKQSKMKDLAIKTQNRRGGTPQYKENLGYANIIIDNGTYILADNYEGQGDNYKKAEETNIQIVVDGMPLFIGSVNELVNRLTESKL